MSVDGRKMEMFLKRKKEIRSGAGYDSALINGLMTVIIAKEDLKCSATGKRGTMAIPLNKRKLLEGNENI